MVSRAAVAVAEPTDRIFPDLTKSGLKLTDCVDEFHGWWAS
jgi:hypothetical protein